MALQVCESRGRVVVEPDEQGVFAVHDQREYLIRSDEPLEDHLPVLRVQPMSEARTAVVCFENFVGLAQSRWTLLQGRPLEAHGRDFRRDARWCRG